MNYKLIATKLGNFIKHKTNIDEINKIACAIFNFKYKVFNIENFTSKRAQLIYNWILTLSKQKISDDEKISLLKKFVNSLAPGNNNIKNLIYINDKDYDLNWDIIHPLIISVSKNKFNHSFYADSVESAFKEVNTRVKKYHKLKKRIELDGAELMNHAFSAQNPSIILDDLSTESGKNIQIGYMQIFVGSMIGIRNPKAHENIVIDKARAIHFLFLSSLLMWKLDEANI